MVERNGPGYKCACKKARVALMDDLLGKRYANFCAGNTCMKGQFLVFSKCNEVDVCRAIDTVGFGNRSVSLIKHNTCGRILGFKLVKVDPAMLLDPQEKLLWVEGNFALLKDEILKTKGYPLTDSDEEKKEKEKEEKEKEKKKMEEERLNEEKLRKKKEKKEKVKARKGKERGVEKGRSLEAASLEDVDKMLLLEKFTSLGTEKERGIESPVEASFKATEKVLLEVFEEIQKAMEGGHKKEKEKEKEKEKDKKEEEERNKKKEEEDH